MATVWCVDFAPSAVDNPWAPSVGSSSAGGDVQRCLLDTGIDTVIRHSRWPRQAVGRSLVGTAVGLGAFTRSSLSDRVTPLIVLGRFVGPFRKPFSLSGGVWAARSRSGEDPVLLPDLPRAGRTGYSPLDTRRPNPPCQSPPLCCPTVLGVRGGDRVPRTALSLAHLFYTFVLPFRNTHL